MKSEKKNFIEVYKVITIVIKTLFKWHRYNITDNFIIHYLKYLWLLNINISYGL